MSQSHRHNCFLTGGGLKRETHMPKLRILGSRNIEKCARTTRGRVRVYFLLPQEIGDAKGPNNFMTEESLLVHRPALVQTWRSDLAQRMRYVLTILFMQAF